ncbi:MAG: hypothetical protein RQ723_03790 [Desulfuromonadales bacterium]|nr:hypothetical protein [Desulfuromonadales bacterium]
MNGHIILGLFSLYVAIISLWLVLSGRQDDLLLRLRRFWGRRTGHSLYFLLNVATPLIICVLALGWGVRTYDADLLVAALNEPHSLRLQANPTGSGSADFPNSASPDANLIIYGA